MIGSFLTRGLVLIFGYAYPAYECYKTVELDRPEIEQLRFWCQYWILVAVLTVCERIGDAFISWVPMYSEAKLAFFIYLWYPKTKGTAYVYDSFFRPYVAKHETEIDRSLLELRTRAGDMTVQYWQRAASYVQTRFLEILQYIAAQSTATRRPSQQPPQGARARQPAAAPNRQPAAAPNRQTSNGPKRQQAASPNPEPLTASQTKAEEPPSPTSSVTSSQHQKEVEVEVGPSQGLKKATSAAPLADQRAPIESNSNSLSAPTQVETMEVEAVPPPINDKTDPPPQETVMEETIRVTRGRLRRARAGANP